jgi:hypothetical protein
MPHPALVLILANMFHRVQEHIRGSGSDRGREHARICQFD